jgi:putative chitinase
MQISTNQIRQLFPQNKHPDHLAEVFNEIFPKYNITTVNRAAGFLAQCGHESAGFTILKENLNYGAKGLMGTFKKYFPTESLALAYERQPEKIANRVYANRMGNGPESSGDGYRYRGRGAIQLTGRDNYSRFAASMGMSLDEVIEDLETLDGAIESACWFWATNGLNAICDADDIVKMTKKINGGTIGLEDRKQHYEHAKHLLADSSDDDTDDQEEDDDDTAPVEYTTVRLGSKGQTVAALQQALGLNADGVFGPGTDRALKQWQAASGLTPDGVAGPKTLQRLLG